MAIYREWLRICIQELASHLFAGGISDPRLLLAISKYSVIPLMLSQFPTVCKNTIITMDHRQL